MREQIIRILKAASGFVSGQELSGKLKISRAAVWKHVRELRRHGYSIEAVTNCGYRLKSSPDKISAAEIQAGLDTRYIGKNAFCHESLSSTMDEAARLAREGAAEGTVVCADAQTKGRGRMGREWVSPKSKGIYLSVILRPDLPITEVAKITLMTAVAVADAVRNISGLDARIKWPNDLLLGKKKIAGILTELNAEVDRVNFLIVGIGVNVNAGVRQLPDTATSLLIGAGKSFRRAEVARHILEGLEARYEEVRRCGFGEILKSWRQISATLGRQVQVSDGGKTITGIAIDLADDGGLLIRDNSGKIIKRMSGDVVVLEGREK